MQETSYSLPDQFLEFSSLGFSGCCSIIAPSLLRSPAQAEQGWLDTATWPRRLGRSPLVQSGEFCLQT